MEVFGPCANVPSAVHLAMTVPPQRGSIVIQNTVQQRLLGAQGIGTNTLKLPQHHPAATDIVSH
jgi:hypothetical protein